jgi:type IV pilus assembly protein PilE
MQKSTEFGFSLFELLIVLTIIGILTVIAYPIYTHALIKTRRSEAKVALINLANRMEGYYLENNNSYSGATLAKLSSNEKTDHNFYKLSLYSTNNTYKITAAATFHDPECQCFILNELGEKTNSGSLDQCW